MSVTIIARRPWRKLDKLLALRFPQRKATLLPAVWVDELMQKRFGALIVCGPCAVKYREGLVRWAYVRHPDMKVQGNACDFCRQVPPGSTPLWFREEHRYPDQNEYARQAREAFAPWPTSFQGQIFQTRRRACFR